jgi:adenosylcobinamide-GDP ribazoletransferase
MKSFILALSFFTRISFIKAEFDEEVFAKSVKWAPVVGLLIGSLLYLISFVLQDFDTMVVNIIIIMLYIGITGGLHLDGLSDTADGIFSGRGKDKILEIMRDSRVGTFGVLSLALWLASMLIILGVVPREAIIIFPVVGKSAPIVSAYFSQYIRSEGLGKIFATNCKALEFSLALIISCATSLILGWQGLVSNLIALLIVYLTTRHLKKIIGGITGDTMGFVCEVSQVIFLFSIYFLQGVSL